MMTAEPSMLCRLCATACDTCTSLLDPVNGHLARWVVTYVGIQIEKPNCPCHICEDCDCFIGNCIKFITRCQDIQETFTSPLPTSEVLDAGNDVKPDSCVSSDNYVTSCTSVTSFEQITPHATEPEFVDCIDIKEEPLDQDQFELTENEQDTYSRTSDSETWGGADVGEFVTSVQHQDQIEAPDAAQLSTKAGSRQPSNKAGNEQPVRRAGNKQPSTQVDKKQSRNTTENKLSVKKRSTKLLKIKIDTKQLKIKLNMKQLHDKESSKRPTKTTMKKQNTKTVRQPDCPPGAAKSSAGEQKTVTLGAPDSPVKACSILLTKLPSAIEDSMSHICTHCDKIFTSRSDLHKHVAQSHSKATLKYKRSFVCPKCKSKFVHRDSLTWHVQYCKTQKQLPIKTYTTSENKTIYQCTDCNKEFKALRDIQYHIRRMHVTVQSFKCEICHKGFGFKASLSQHMSVHKTVTAAYDCNICGAVFKRKNHLKDHVKTLHSSDSTVINCTKCPATFKYKKILVHHMRMVHDSGKQWNCEKCDGVFKCKQYLSQHMRRVHSGKTFMCDLCDYKTHAKHLLKQHLRGVHAQGPPVSCPVCNRDFKYKRNMLEHKRMVHSFAHVSCALCSFSTKSKQHLLCHVKRHLK